MSFEITFLGASGGPIEGNTCSILLKPAKIPYAELIQNTSNDSASPLLLIDAGSGLGSLSEIIYNECHGKVPYSKLLDIYPDALGIHDYIKTQVSFPFRDAYNAVNIASPFQLAQTIFCACSNFLISHPHLDHIAGLVINSAGFSKCHSKRVHGSSLTLAALQNHIFNGIIWPNMPFYRTLSLEPHSFGNTWKAGVYNVTMFELSHGKYTPLNQVPSTVTCTDSAVPSSPISPPPKNVPRCESLEGNNYSSSSFLINHPENNHSILIFGDCEADSVSGTRSNHRIWRHSAPLVVDKSLKAIILECSNTNGINEHELYGHMVPDHLISEFKALESECYKINSTLQPLRGLNVIINHVKEPVIGGDKTDIPLGTTLVDPRQKVLRELNEINHRENLGLNFSIALSGATIVI